MMIRRREFSLGVLGAMLAGCRTASPTTPPSKPESSLPDAPKRVLILGGTGFLGPALVEQCQAMNAEVTLFNRGKTRPHLFPELEKLRGDRNGDLSALEGRSFDWVLDTSGQIPRQVEASAGLLSQQAERYVFVSSISAYANLSVPGVEEGGATIPMPEPYSEAMPQHYGALKAGCERAAEAAMPGRATVVRPGLIVGPGDPTDRFTYWPTRVARGGDVVAPNSPDDPAQFIDVRDLAAFILHTQATEQSGTFNVTGPTEATTMGGLLDACKTVTNSDAAFHWVPTPSLTKHGVAPWMELTVWVPPDDAEFGGMSRVSISKAVAAGLKTRAMQETIADTLAWWETLPEARRSRPRAGLASQKEQAVLAALAESQPSSAA
ncbi:MAG: NAD-dependent epimerase/dehydratase family protein [Nannocystales bacterium]